MSNSKPLTHVTIINSRPLHQREDLTLRLHQLGATVIEVPCITIQHEKKTVLQQQVSQLNTPQHLIFVSANAVHSLIPEYQPPTETHIIAIGAGTAHALSTYGIKADTIPNHYSSQGILDLPELQQIHQQRIIISCGHHSRPQLQHTLEQRGANVECIQSYRRTPAKPASRIIEETIQQTTINAIIVTSQASLDQLPLQFPLLGQQWVKQQQLLLITQEQAQKAKKIGFTSIPWIAGQADMNSLIDCLLHHATTCR